MDCKDVKNLLQPYIDGELDKEKEKAVREHISSCGSCEKEYRELEKYANDISSLKEVSAPANFLEEINRRIDSASLYRRIIDKIFFPLLWCNLFCLLQILVSSGY